MPDDILVLRLSSLGDVVLTSTFLQSAAEHFPGSRVTFVVRDDLTEVANALPNVKRVVAVRRDAGLGALLSLAATFARDGYAHVFDLHQSLRSRLLTTRVALRLRPGFSKQPLSRWALLHWKHDVYGRGTGPQPLRLRMLEPLRRLGFEPRPYDTRLVLPAGARTSAGRLLQRSPGNPMQAPIAVVPGARWPAKRWLADRFTNLVARLCNDAQQQVVLLGGPGEEALCAQAALACPERTLDLCGKLDLLTTAAVLERCAAAITNDSGLAHVAEAVGRPTIVLFGATSPRFGYAPYRPTSRFLYDPPSCSPCSKNGSRACSRPTHECMENLSVETVFEAALETCQAIATDPTAKGT